MGCKPSKESTPSKPKREILYGSNTQPPDRRYFPAPAPKHVVFEESSRSSDDTRGSGEAARPKETDPAPKHVTFKEPSERNHGARGLGTAYWQKESKTKGSKPKECEPKESRPKESRPKESRPEETFEAYAQRGVIRHSAIAPESEGSKRTKSSSHKKRVGGFEKYTQE